MAEDQVVLEDMDLQAVGMAAAASAATSNVKDPVGMTTATRNVLGISWQHSLLFRLLWVLKAYSHTLVSCVSTRVKLRFCMLPGPCSNVKVCI